MAVVSGKKETKPDLPILNRPTGPSLVTWPLFVREMEKVLESRKAFDDHIKIHELRKSCGVPDSEQSRINIRRPPRYRDLSKP